MREDVDFLKRGAHTKLSSRKRQEGGEGLRGRGQVPVAFLKGRGL